MINIELFFLLTVTKVFKFSFTKLNWNKKLQINQRIIIAIFYKYRLPTITRLDTKCKTLSFYSIHKFMYMLG